MAGGAKTKDRPPVLVGCDRGCGFHRHYVLAWDAHGFATQTRPLPGEECPEKANDLKVLCIRCGEWVLGVPARGEWYTRRGQRIVELVFDPSTGEEIHDPQAREVDVTCFTCVPQRRLPSVSIRALVERQQRGERLFRL